MLVNTGCRVSLQVFGRRPATTHFGCLRLRGCAAVPRGAVCLDLRAGTAVLPAGRHQQACSNTSTSFVDCLYVCARVFFCKPSRCAFCNGRRHSLSLLPPALLLAPPCVCALFGGKAPLQLRACLASGSDALQQCAMTVQCKLQRCTSSQDRRQDTQHHTHVMWCSSRVLWPESVRLGLETSACSASPEVGLTLCA